MKKLLIVMLFVSLAAPAALAYERSYGSSYSQDSDRQRYQEIQEQNIARMRQSEQNYNRQQQSNYNWELERYNKGYTTNVPSAPSYRYTPTYY